MIFCSWTGKHPVVRLCSHLILKHFKRSIIPARCETLFFPRLPKLLFFMGESKQVNKMECCCHAWGNGLGWRWNLPKKVKVNNTHPCTSTPVIVSQLGIIFLYTPDTALYSPDTTTKTTNVIEDEARYTRIPTHSLYMVAGNNWHGFTLSDNSITRLSSNTATSTKVNMSTEGTEQSKVWFNSILRSRNLNSTALTWNTQLHGRHVFEKSRSLANWLWRRLRVDSGWPVWRKEEVKQGRRRPPCSMRHTWARYAMLLLIRMGPTGTHDLMG